MIAHIHDANIPGYLEREVESADELVDLFEAYSGLWYDWSGDGVAILDEPSAWLFEETPGEDAYPDVIVDYRDYGWVIEAA